MIVLEIRKLKYWSQLDEDLFFYGLKKIRGVRKVYGRGLSLFIEVDSNRLKDADLRNLIGLYHRYRINMKQLAGFETVKNRSWFRKNRVTFWYSKVFGKK